MTECAQTKCWKSGCVVTRRMTSEMCSKRRVRNREGVETDVVDTNCAQSNCVGKRGCPSEYKQSDCLGTSDTLSEIEKEKRIFVCQEAEVELRFIVLGTCTCGVISHLYRNKLDVA